MRFLHEPAWLLHEVAMYRATGIDVPAAAERTIRLPVFAGRTLAFHLKLSPSAARSNAFGLCVERLRHLHSAGGSHGDAHAGNVLVCPDAGVAQWIDFETEHVATLSAEARLADDLRALVTSSLMICGSDFGRQMIAPLLATGPAVVDLLIGMIRHPARSLLHRAQGDPPSAVRRDLCDLLTAHAAVNSSPVPLARR